MAARPSTFQRPQIGLEVTPGIAVPASKWLQATSIRLRPQIPVDAFRPTGLRFPTDGIPQKGMGSFTYEGRINQGGDLVYILESLLGKAAAAGTWLYEPPIAAPPATGIQAYTIETGQAGGNGSQLTGSLFTEAEFVWNRTTSQVRGSGFGQLYTPGVAMTATPTAVPKALANHGKVKVEVGDTIGGLVKITDCLEVSHFIRGTMGQLYTLNEATDTYDEAVYLAPEVGGRLIVEQGTNSNGYLTDLKSSKQKFIRITSQGPVLTTGPTVYYRSVHIFPFKFRADDEGEDQNVETGVFDLLPNYDDAYGKVMSLQVFNGMSAL